MNNPTGTCVFFYANGSIYLGDLSDGEKSGFGRYLYVNGDIYEGEWISNKKHGKGVYSYYRTGDVYEGDWKLDMKSKFGCWYKNGIAYDGEWRNGEMVNLLSMQPGQYNQPLENLIDFYTDDTTVENLVKNLVGRFEKSKEGVNNLGQIDVDFDKLEIVENEGRQSNDGNVREFDSFN